MLKYTVPESKAITYAVLQPEMLIDIVESESILRKLYDEQKQEYNKPEQRTVERLFFKMDKANSVMAD